MNNDDGYRDALAGTIKSHVDAATKEYGDAMRFLYQSTVGKRMGDDELELAFNLGKFGESSYNELSDVMAYSIAGIGMLADVLVSQGVAQRTKDALAPEKTVVSLTPKYKKLIDIISKEVNK